MADTYANFAELEANTTIGVDYELYSIQRSPQLIVMTPHGGGIETGTSEVVVALSDLLKASRYIFEAKRSSNNRELHLTSTHYDEPQAIAVMPKHTDGISVHGYADSILNTIVGGRDTELRDKIVRELQAAGFNAEIATDRFTGTDPDNIINRTAKGAGVQLELSTAQRKAFFEGGDWSRANRGNTTEAFDLYVAAVAKAYNS